MDTDRWWPAPDAASIRWTSRTRSQSSAPLKVPRRTERPGEAVVLGKVPGAIQVLDDDDVREGEAVTADRLAKRSASGGVGPRAGAARAEKGRSRILRLRTVTVWIETLREAVGPHGAQVVESSAGLRSSNVSSRRRRTTLPRAACTVSRIRVVPSAAPASRTRSMSMSIVVCRRIPEGYASLTACQCIDVTPASAHPMPHRQVVTTPPASGLRRPASASGYEPVAEPGPARQESPSA